jgi:hypothetical protein
VGLLLLSLFRECLGLLRLLAGRYLDLLRSFIRSLDLARSFAGGYLDLLRLLPGRYLDLLPSLEIRLLDDLAPDLGGRAPGVPPHLRYPGEGLLVGDPE